MTHLCCPGCRLRFTPAVSASLAACPQCGEALQLVAGAHGVIGFRLFEPEDPGESLPEALSVSLPLPDPGATRTSGPRRSY